MAKLNDKINDVFQGMVVRKDLSKSIKGNAVVPTYVLEYLLGQYCATDDEETIKQGQERVTNILAKHYVHRSESELVKSTIKEKGSHKVIDKVSVVLNEKTDNHEASFFNMGLKKIPIRVDFVKSHPKLLVGGVWSIVDLEYEFDETIRQPWNIASLKPIQISGMDINKFLEGRQKFSVAEWIDLLMQSLGFNPEELEKRNKYYQLVRLIAFCERNYNMMELGPKATGKSHVYSEFSPHGILISGGEVTAAKLFVNTGSGKLGLLGYWDNVAFDEIAGKQKKVDKNLVDIMKNYMANKSFSRGTESVGAEASMTFVGNTKKSVAHMLKHTNLFEELPDKYFDSAFLDRLHFYIPGWEVPILRGEMFTDGYGFIVDYYAEVLKHLRNEDFSQDYKKYFELDSTIATRDRTAIEKTFSGLMKIIFPNRDATKDEMRELLELAIEGRRRIKTQICRIDETFTAVEFSYTDTDTGKKTEIFTLEEETYPQFCEIAADDTESVGAEEKAENKTESVIEDKTDETSDFPEPGEQVIIKESQKGVSYENLFGPCLKGAKEVNIEDPYIRKFYQIRNVYELILVIQGQLEEGDEVTVTLKTKQDEFSPDIQHECLAQLAEGVEGTGIEFHYEIVDSEDIHARSITTDTGWKISLDRGLDIFQNFDTRNKFNLANAVQKERLCKAFEVTYLKT